MYGLDIGDDEQLLVETLHAFAEDEVRAAAREAEHESAVPEALAAALHQLGVASPVPEEFGGQGMPEANASLRIAEELAWGDPAIALAALTPGHVAMLIAECGSPEQKARWLPRFVGDGPLRASLLLHEGFGRQPSESMTRAKRVDGEWSLSGEKVGVLHAGLAELSVVVARDEDGALASFVLEGTPSGLEVLRDDRKNGRLALDAAPTGSVRLDGVRLPADARLVDDTALPATLARIRLANAVLLLGCARAAKEFAQGYANERVAFGRPIASFQGVAFPLADCDMAIETARLELFDAADALAMSEMSGTSEIESLCARVLVRCGEVALQATREGVQTLGGHGFIREYPVERWYRAAAALSALDFDPTFAPHDFI